MGSILSVYSEAGDYDTVDISGEIVYSLQYDERAQSLSVLVKECRELAYADPAKKKCNPWVSITDDNVDKLFNIKFTNSAIKVFPPF